ncbi:MAG TPA: DeoR family transcriptional regulator [Bryobacteraceae bacterium]|jgi:hypothetical protein|nr:DeoR family transcriptional regulator [Bryobacteraceae bacterium]
MSLLILLLSSERVWLANVQGGVNSFAPQHLKAIERLPPELHCLPLANGVLHGQVATCSARHWREPTTDDRATVEESAHKTDTSTVLASVPKHHKHSQVNHTAHGYVRHEDGIAITTNTVKGYFGIIKRGIDGIYLVLDLSERNFEFVKLSKMRSLLPRVAVEYKDMADRTIIRDLETLEEMGLILRGTGGWRAQKEIILAFLPTCTSISGGESND